MAPLITLYLSQLVHLYLLSTKRVVIADCAAFRRQIAQCAQARDSTELSFEELYRNGFYLVIHKHGAELHAKVHEVIYGHMGVLRQRLEDATKVCLYVRRLVLMQAGGVCAACDEQGLGGPHAGHAVHWGHHAVSGVCRACTFLQSCVQNKEYLLKLDPPESVENIGTNAFRDIVCTCLVWADRNDHAGLWRERLEGATGARAHALHTARA